MKLIFFMILIFCTQIEKVYSESLMGSDKNGNGVRDDLDSYIIKNFKGVNNIAAAIQYTKYSQLSHFKTTDKENGKTYLLGVIKSTSCYRALNPEKLYAHKDLNEISSAILNTKARREKSKEKDQVMAGLVMRSPMFGIKGCEFKIKEN